MKEETPYFKVNRVLSFKEDEKVVKTAHIDTAQTNRCPQKSKSEKQQKSARF